MTGSRPLRHPAGASRRVARRRRWCDGPALAACLLLLAPAGCRTLPPPGPTSAAPDTEGASQGARPAPAAFMVGAHSLDAWNAVGQLVVRSDDIRLEGRAQMLDLHVVRFRGRELLVLTRAVPLSATATAPATRVLVVARDGAAGGDVAAGVLLQILREALPAEIARLRAASGARQP